MNTKCRFVAAAVLGFVPAAAWCAEVDKAPALPAAFRPHVQPVKRGRIDWLAGYIIAHGTGLAEGRDHQNQLLAQRAATLDAAANALAISLGIRVDAKGRTGDVRNGRVLLTGVVKGHETIDVQWFPSETPPRSRVSLRVPLWGVKGVASIFYDQQRTAVRRRPPARVPLAIDRVDVSDSVLIIDARGLGLDPCLCPLVIDGSGRVLHDVNRLQDTEVKHGPVVRYVETDLQFEQLSDGGGESDPLVAPDHPTAHLASYPPTDASGAPTTRSVSQPSTRPAPGKDKDPRKRRRRVVVKASAVSGQQKTEIVLTRTDAEKLARSPEGASLIRSGRVVVVVDSAAAGIESRRGDEEREALVALSNPS
ncbi:MAG: hypothetical protein JSV19_03185 [Phycisphaerales bacterium]|nr:MAG: hypothetical protein JSV19_03185 [Phycisphaerales bacterium]